MFNKEELEQESEKLSALLSECQEQRKKVNLLRVSGISELYLGKYIRIKNFGEDEEDKQKNKDFLFVTDIWCSNDSDIYVEGYGFHGEFYDYRDCTSFYWSPFIQEKYNISDFDEEDFSHSKFEIVTREDFFKNFEECIINVKKSVEEDDLESYL